MSGHWSAVKSGWDLEEVPEKFKRWVQCCMCKQPSGDVKLYTDQPLTHTFSISEYRSMLDKLKTRCFCQRHAEEFFEI